MAEDTTRDAEIDRDDALVARENWTRYRYGVSRGHRDYTGLASRLEGFYLGGDRDANGKLIGGGQWSADDLDVLEEQQRPAYEFNEIMPAVNAAIGYQIHNRMDIAFRPRGGDASKELAEVRSKVAMQIADNNSLHWLETEMYADGLVQQRGYLEARMDFDDSIFGELRFSVLDPMDVIPDPDAKSYNPKDWSDVIITRWLTLDEIEGMYGLEARRRAEDSPSNYLDEQDFGDGDDDGQERNKFSRDDFGAYDAEYHGSGERRLRIIDRQKWIRMKADVIVMPGGDIRMLAGDETPEVLDHMLKGGGVRSVRRMKRVRWTVSTMSTTLHNDWSPYDRLTVIPYFPYFRRGRTRGMVDNAISPQEALNKGMSQYIHIINTTANSGWQVEEDQLTNMTTEELEESGSKTGLVIERRAGTNPLEKIQPNQIPTGVDKMIERAAFTLKEVTVPDAMRGTQGPEVSGVAIQSKQHAAQQGLAVPLDNLGRTRTMVAGWIDYAIGKYYDSERLFRITKIDPKTGKEEEEALVINEFDPETGSYHNDLTVGEYDVVVSEQPVQVTFEASQFNQAMEMRRAGIALPDPFVLRYSNLADKFEAIQMMEAQSQQPAPDPLQVAEEALRRARAEKELALARKADADAVTSGVTGMFSAAQTAGAIATNPDVAPLADDLLRSAGFVDRDQPPIIPGASGEGAASRLEQPAQNTSPMFPARPGPDELEAEQVAAPVPDSAVAGVNEGIETQAIERV